MIEARERTDNAMPAPLRTTLAFALLACAACGSRETWRDNLYPLPSAEPLRTRLAATEGSAALSIADLPPRPLKREGALELFDLLDSMEDSFPLLSAAEQARVISRARALAARAPFDLTLKGKAFYAPNGFFQHNGVDTRLSQRTGLYGLEVFGGYRLGAGDFDPTFDGKRVTNHGGEFNAGFSVPLLQGGAIDEARAAVLAADADVGLADAAVRQRRIAFVLEATRAYWDWLAAGRGLGIARDLLRLAEQRRDQIAKRIERGDLAAIDGVDNERLVAERKAAEILARRKFEKSSLTLSLFLRDAEGRPLLPQLEQLPPGFADPDALDEARVEDDLLRALEQSPKLAAIALKRRQLEVESGLRENQLMPELDFTFKASQDLDDVAPSKTKGDFELALGLELKLPAQQRKARGKLLAARAKLRQLDEQERFLRDSIQAKVRDVISEIRAQVETIVQTRRVVQLSRRLAEAERTLFLQGQSDLLRVNLREDKAAKAEKDTVEALQAYWKSVADYRASLSIDQPKS